MANGIFLAPGMFNGEPTLFQYTMRPDDPVVLVELYKPAKEDLIPRAPDMSTAFGHNLVSKPETYLNRAISEQIEKLGQEQWAAVLAENGEPRPANWDEVVKGNVTKFLESPDIAHRLVERVSEDAVIVKINPMDYPEPLRQRLLSTPHLEKGVHCHVVPDEE